MNISSISTYEIETDSVNQRDTPPLIDWKQSH